MQLHKCLVAMGVFLPLCGFYVTDQPVLDAGDCIPEAAGKFVCTVQNKAVRVTNSELKSGLFSRTCRYKDDVLNADTLNKRTPMGLVLQQTHVQNLYSYGFSQIIDVNNSQSLAPASGTTDNLLAKYRIDTRRMPGTPFIVLQGSRDNVVQFLMAHNKNHLDVAGTCKRQR